MVRSPLLVVMCAGYFLGLLDVTVVNVALPDIGGALALFLPLTLLAPATGRVAARLGPRPPLVAGLLLAAAGFAPAQRSGSRRSERSRALRRTRVFLSGLHLTGLVAAALFLVAALSTLLMRSN